MAAVARVYFRVQQGGADGGAHHCFVPHRAVADISAWPRAGRQHADIPAVTVAAAATTVACHVAVCHGSVAVRHGGVTVRVAVSSNVAAAAVVARATPM